MGSFFSLISTEQTMTKQNCFLEFFLFMYKNKRTPYVLKNQTFRYETCSLSLKKKNPLLSTVTLILLQTDWNTLVPH